MVYVIFGNYLVYVYVIFVNSLVYIYVIFLVYIYVILYLYGLRLFDIMNSLLVWFILLLFFGWYYQFTLLFSLLNWFSVFSFFFWSVVNTKDGQNPYVVKKKYVEPKFKLGTNDWAEKAWFYEMHELGNMFYSLVNIGFLFTFCV